MKGKYLMNTISYKLFVCFAAENRYNIAEPTVFHLKNYGIETWYDRHSLIMGDNRITKNLIEGASECKYALVILSQYTSSSECAMEELSIIKARYDLGEVTIFPILYELSPGNIPYELSWIKEIIFKEVDRHSGTREICNHIACKITGDIVNECTYHSIQDIIHNLQSLLPTPAYEILRNYQEIDNANLNSRIALLYAVYLTIFHSSKIKPSSLTTLVTKIFERLFSETKLNLTVDYRELWLLENAICILVNCYIISCTESKM